MFVCFMSIYITYALNKKLTSVEGPSQTPDT